MPIQGNAMALKALNAAVDKRKKPVDPYKDDAIEEAGVQLDDLIPQNILKKLGLLGVGQVNFLNPRAEVLYKQAREFINEGISKGRINPIFMKMIQALERHPTNVKISVIPGETGKLSRGEFHREVRPNPGSRNSVIIKEGNSPGKTDIEHVMDLIGYIPPGLRNPEALMAHETFGHGFQNVVAGLPGEAYPGMSWLPSSRQPIPRELLSSYYELLYPPFTGKSSYGSPYISNWNAFKDFTERVIRNAPKVK